MPLKELQNKSDEMPGVTVSYKWTFRELSSGLCYVKNKASIREMAGDSYCSRDNKRHGKKACH